MRIPALLLVLLLPAAVPAQEHADPALAAIARRLERPAVVRGDFVQVRHIAGLSRPLVSRGRFVVARGSGVLWDTAEPFAQRLSITTQGLRTAQADGSGAFVGGAPAGPAGRELSLVLGALFAADLAVLERYFRVHGETPSGDWRIVLEPRNDALAQIFSGIEMQGDRLITGIALREANGDRTDIRFENAIADKALADGERRALDF